eukprot:Gb_30100 [translate_table: standard]
MQLSNTKVSRKDESLKAGLQDSSKARTPLQEKIAGRNCGCIKLCGGFNDNGSETSVFRTIHRLVGSSSSSSPPGEKKNRKMFNKDSSRNKESKMQNKYLRPGALAQLRDARMNTRAMCKAIGRKRVLFVGHGFTSPTSGAENNVCLLPENKMVPIPNIPSDPATPKTPTIDSGQDAEQVNGESRLESLPLDLLVRILCYLHHDQLRAMFHVSQRIRKAVVVARRFHFNYTTPDRGRQELLNRGAVMQGVMTPKAPRHGPRPPPRLSLAEMRQIAASLFQGSSSILNGKKPPGLPRSSYRSLGSHRVLFYEEELCQAVAHNTIQ